MQLWQTIVKNDRGEMFKKNPNRLNSLTLCIRSHPNWRSLIWLVCASSNLFCRFLVAFGCRLNLLNDWRDNNTKTCYHRQSNVQWAQNYKPCSKVCESSLCKSTIHLQSDAASIKVSGTIQQPASELKANPITWKTIAVEWNPWSKMHEWTSLYR